MANKSYESVAGTITKVRAEQIKSEDALGTLAGDLAAIRGQIQDIIGAPNYKEDVSAVKVQILDLENHIDAASSNTEIEVKQDLKVSGDAHVVGSLDVDVEATMASAVVEDLTAERIVIAGAGGAIQDSAELTFGAAGLYVDNAAEITGALTVGGEAQFDSNVAVSGELSVSMPATFADDVSVTGDLSVTGESTLASAIVSDLTATRIVYAGASGALVDSASLTYDGSELRVDGTFEATGNAEIGGNLTVAGDLTIQGTTTTVNSTTVSVDDKNIELGSTASPSDASATGGGITLKGTTDKEILWLSGQSAWVFSEGLEPKADASLDIGAATYQWKDLYMSGDAAIGGDVVAVGDVSAANATFTVDLSVDGDATVAGDLDVTGNFSAAHVTDSSLTAGRVVFAGTAGQLADDAEFLFDAAGKAFTIGATGQEHMVKVTGSVEVTGHVYMMQDLAVNSSSKFRGEVQLVPGFGYVSGSVLPSVSGEFALGLGPDRLWSEVSSVGHFLLPDGHRMNAAGDQTILKQTSGKLILSQSVGGSWMQFDDAHRGATELSAGLKGIKLANSGEWAAFAAKSHFAGIDSLLGTFNAISAELTNLAAGGASKKLRKGLSATNAMVAINISADATGAGLPAVGYSNSLVFLNGQLLNSGSVGQVAGGTHDYTLDDGYTGLKFSFAVETGDQLVIQKL